MSLSSLCVIAGNQNVRLMKQMTSVEHHHACHALNCVLAKSVKTMRSLIFLQLIMWFQKGILERRMTLKIILNVNFLHSY